MANQLKRVTEYQWVFGVCSGLAYWLNLPSLLVRFIMFVSVYIYGMSILPYLFLWVLLPEWEDTPSDYEKICGDY